MWILIALTFAHAEAPRPSAYGWRLYELERNCRLAARAVTHQFDDGSWSVGACVQRPLDA